MAVNVEKAQKVGQTSAETGKAIDQVGSAAIKVCEHSAGIAQATEQIAQRCGQFRESVEALNLEASRSSLALSNANRNLNEVLNSAEAVLMLTATSGFATIDTRFIAEAQRTGKAIEARFQRAIQAGELSQADLFDKQLNPIAGSNPPQFMTRYIEFLDREILPIIDAVLAFDPQVVFCAPTDHNKMIPCHNPNFRHAQGADPIWNAAHCRNRRIYNDKTAEAVAKSTAPFLLQTYRRDMGGGNFVLMKDASAPIKVDGVLWGGVRICYRA